MRRVKKIEIDVESGVMEIDTTKIDISKYGAVNIRVDLLFECVDVLKYGKAPSKPKNAKNRKNFSAAPNRREKKCRSLVER